MLVTDPRVDMVSFTGIHRDGPCRDGGSGADADEGVPRARWQVRCGGARRRRPRVGRGHGRVQRVHPRRPGLRTDHEAAGAAGPVRRGGAGRCRRPWRPSEPRTRPTSATVCGPVISRPPARPGAVLPRARRAGGRHASSPAAASPTCPTSSPAATGCSPRSSAGLANDARVAREEVFGPVLVVIPHDGDDDAVRLANDSPYGLSGSVDSGDLERAQCRRPAHPHRHPRGQRRGVVRARRAVRWLQAVGHRPRDGGRRVRGVPRDQGDGRACRWWPMTSLRLGFVGLGQIGQPMALRARSPRRAGSPSTTSPRLRSPSWSRPGRSGATDVAELAPRADVLCVMVRDDDQVRGSRRCGSSGRLLAGVVVRGPLDGRADDPGRARRGRRGVRRLGGRRPGERGTGRGGRGPAGDHGRGRGRGVERCREPSGCWATCVVHAGPVGAGTRLKLARNLVHFVSFTAVTEAQRLAAASGLDLRALGEVVRHTDAITGGPGAIMHRDHGAAARTRRLLVRRPRRPCGPSGRRTSTSRSTWPTSLGVDVPLARLALEHGSGPGWDWKELIRDDSSTDCPDRRRRGLEKMEQVYGFEMSDGDGDFFGYTADHLFADIWNRPGLSDRDRRLLLIGMLATHGAQDVLGLQVAGGVLLGRPRRRDAARDRRLRQPLRRLAGRRPAQLVGRGDDREGPLSVLSAAGRWRSRRPRSGR